MIEVTRSGKLSNKIIFLVILDKERSNQLSCTGDLKFDAIQTPKSLNKELKKVNTISTVNIQVFLSWI